MLNFLSVTLMGLVGFYEWPTIVNTKIILFTFVGLIFIDMS
jgi:hypothetical protein